MEQTKECTRCGVNNSIENYHYSNKSAGILKSVCKECSYQYVKEHIAKDPLAYKSYMQRYAKEHPEIFVGNHHSKKTPPVSGVYLIDCLLTDHSYVGCSSNMRNRRYKHARNVGRSKQHNLSKLIKEYGWGCFEFRVLEECDKDKIFERETFWIQKLNPNLNKNKTK